jgi:GNAT superfamily N-acetyltransferase
MTTTPRITLSAERDPHAEAVISGGLADYNRETFGRVDSTTLDVLVHDEKSGEIVGGILGHTSLGLFFLDLFYLPKELRRGGLGSRLIAQAEDEARRRGCSAAFVITVTFQAPGFYERHGYRRFGEVACPPDGATRIFLSKPLG